MRAAELLEAVAARGAVAYLEGVDVWVSPADALTPELLETLRQHKREIREYLRRQPARVGPWQPPGAVRPPRQCVRCGGGLATGERDGGPCSACRHWFARVEPKRVQ